MARVFLTPIDLAQNELRQAVIQALGSDPGSLQNAQVWVNTSDWTLRIRLNGITIRLGRLDQVSPPLASLSLNGQRITGLADAVAGDDAATLRQVQAASAGLDAKASCVTGSQTNISVTSAPAALDGYSPTTGDRVLLVAQTSPAENGIWVWNGSGSPMTRPSDFTGSNTVTGGAYTLVEHGATMVATGWVLTTDGVITVGTTPQTWVKFSSAGAAGAGKYTQLVGDGSSTSIAVTHSLASSAVLVQLYDATSGAQVECDVTITSSSVVTLGFVAIPTTNQYRVVIVG